MRNFTKQITNKTLFKPTRWLLMALMLLLGTGSAWGAIYLKGSFDSWGTGVQFSGDYNCATAVITLNKGTTYDFKINDGDSWYGNSGSIQNSITGWEFNSNDNCKITPSTTGEYIFIFYKNSNKKLSVIYPNVGNFYLRGAFNNWSANEASKFTNGKCTISLTSGTYEFKIATSDWGIGFGKGNTTISEASNSTTMSSMEGNCKIEIPRDGNYTFEFDVKTSKLSVTYPPSCTAPDAFTISIDNEAICSGGNATITIPNDHSAESYKWCTKNGNNYGNETTIDNKSFTVSAAGTYVVRAYNSTSCMTESNAVTLTVDEEPTITVTEPSTICSGSEIDLSDYVKTDKGTLTYNSNSQSVFTPNDNTTYNIVATNGACSATSTITVTVANETKPQPVALSGNGYNMEGCENIRITVTNNDSILAVLYEGYEITPTPVVDGTKYKKGDIIGEGKVVHKDKANAIAITDLEPEQDHTYVIYQYTDVCKLYSDPLILSLKKNVPEFTPIKITSNGTSVELSTEATHIGTNISGVVIDKAFFYYKKTNDAKWTEIAATKSGKNNKVCTATINNLIQGATYQFKFEASNNSCKDNKVTVEGTEDVTIECPTVTPPTLTGAAYCGSQNSVTLPTVSGYWYDSQTDGNKVTSPVNVANTTTYYATSKDGECESVRVPYTITINPVPTITVDAGNETPFLNQEVELTATGNDIESVAWSANPGSITPNLDDSKKAILTHSSAEAVTVTATATSEAGCTSETTKKVTFSEERDCEPTITTHNNKTKVRVKKDNCPWNIIKIYSHGGQSSGDWPGVNMTEGTGEDAGYYVYKFESVSSNFKVIFNNGNANGENQTVSGTATKGKVCTYTIGANSCTEENNSRRCLEVATSDYKTTTPAEISAPAVNTVSVTSQVGSGVVNFTGQVVKTGCAANNKIYVGYQYKLAYQWCNCC